MAYIVCYLQRTPRGLHPASLVGACLARDVGSNRGAAIIGVTTGDGSDGDEQVIVDASRCGIDQLLFAGPNGLGTAFTRLRPMHVIVPWTSEGKRALDPTALRVTAPTWVTGKVASNVTLDPVLGVVAGTLPWVDSEGTAYAEYEEDYREAAPASWGEQAEPAGPLVYVAPRDIAENTRAGLEACGATPVSPDYAQRHEHGTLLWFDAGPAGLPAQLESRKASARVMLLPGPMARTDVAWSRADWVLPGAWPEAVEQLQADTWRNVLAR